MKKQLQKILPILLLIALVAALFWVRQESNAKTAVADLLEGQYQSSFYDLVSGMENTAILTGKVQYSSSPKKQIQYLTQISQQAATALKNLGNLPLQHNSITRSGKFLNQLGDYSGTLANKLIAGKPLTDAEKENLKASGEQVAEVSTELLKLQKQLDEENILFYSKVEQGSDQDIIGNHFAAIDQRAQDYPSLEYQGAMSSHMEKMEVLGLTDPTITVEEAIKKAKALTGILGTAGDYIFTESTEGTFSENALIPLYRLTAKQGEEEIFLDISKQGGKPVMILNTRPLGGVTITTTDAQKKAEAFLQTAGFSNMVLNSSYDAGNSITFTYRANDNQITAAADEVQVRIGLDNGQVIGANAAKYFIRHHTREAVEPKLTEPQARAKVTGIQPEGPGNLTFLTTTYGEEVLCYEFTGQGYKVYINADNGEEEDLLQILEGEGGSYTR